MDYHKFLPNKPGQVFFYVVTQPLLNVSRYFDSPKYSDVIIRFDGGELKAHKMILAEGSEYFKTCFNSEFKVGTMSSYSSFARLMNIVPQESNSNVIELHGDDPRVIRGVIAYIYGRTVFGEEYKDNGEWYAFGEGYETKTGCDQLDAIKYEIDLYVCATKYLVTGICYSIIREWRACCGKTAMKQLAIIEAVARYIYITRADEATEFRKPLASMIARLLSALKNPECFKSLYVEIPEFAFDVIQASTKKAEGKKRKLDLLAEKRNGDTRAEKRRIIEAWSSDPVSLKPKSMP